MSTGSVFVRIRALSASATLAVLVVLSNSQFAHASCLWFTRYEVSDGKVSFRAGGKVFELPDIDAATFRVFMSGGGMDQCRAGYATDRNAVVYEGKRVDGADAATFQVIMFDETLVTVYAKDRYRVYGEGVPISDAIDSFRLLRIYATDGNKGFLGSKVLPGDKFQELDTATYAKSTAGVFWDGKLVKGLDPETFKVLLHASAYARDATKVVLRGHVIEGADPDTFAVIQTFSDHAKDKFRVYHGAEPIVGADPSTIRWIDGSFIRDARAVYRAGKEITGADPSTFEVRSNGQTRDKNFEYSATGQALCTRRDGLQSPLNRCP